MRTLRRLAPVLLGVVALLSACAHQPTQDRSKTLKKAVDTFDQRVRWKDFRGAMQLLVPERRDGFDDARNAQNDERDLSVTEIEIEDAQLSPDGSRAIVLSRYSWMRLPSTSVKSERVTSEWVFASGAWFLTRQVGGPFESELGISVPTPAREEPGREGLPPSSDERDGRGGADDDVAN